MNDIMFSRSYGTNTASGAWPLVNLADILPEGSDAQKSGTDRWSV